MFKYYKYRLLPSDEQKELINRWFGMCRFIYNLGLEVKIRSWQSARKNVSSFDLMKQMTELKNTECPWLKEIPRQALESSLVNLGAAYDKFFKGGGFPNFKKRGCRQSMQFRLCVYVYNSSIKLPGLGFIKLIYHRPLESGKIKHAVVI